MLLKLDFVDEFLKCDIVLSVYVVYDVVEGYRTAP